MKTLIINADNFEDSELLVPYYRLKEAGVEETVATLNRGAHQGQKKHGYEVTVDNSLKRGSLYKSSTIISASSSKGGLLYV